MAGDGVVSTGGARSNPNLLHDASRSDLDLAWRDREAEAASLIAAGSFSMGLALRVYALEIRLKWRICRLLMTSRIS
jgi:hypothetical protein